MLFFALDENKEIVFIQKAIKKKDYYWFLLKDCVLNRSENYDWFFIKNAKKLYLHSYINYIDEKDRNTDIIIIDLMYKDEIIKRINEFVMEAEGDEF